MYLRGERRSTLIPEENGVHSQKERGECHIKVTSGRDRGVRPVGMAMGEAGGLKTIKEISPKKRAWDAEEGREKDVSARKKI